MNFYNEDADETGAISRPMSEINTTPLVDVMLVLLVVFIVTAPLLSHNLKIQLPQESTQPVESKLDTVIVSIDEFGSVYWDKTLIPNHELSAKLASAAMKTPKPEIQIRADKNTKYEVLAKIMADAQNAGIPKIGFLTEPN